MDVHGVLPELHASELEFAWQDEAVVGAGPHLETSAALVDAHECAAMIEHDDVFVAVMIDIEELEGEALNEIEAELCSPIDEDVAVSLQEVVGGGHVAHEELV